MRSILALAIVGLLAVPASGTDSFRPVYEHGSGELVLDLVFGSEDESDDAFIMSSWLSFSVAGNGDVYVLESQLCLVKRFNANGEFVSVFGEEGEGPGALRMPSKIAVAPDGKLWIYELGNRRFSVFTPDGEFVETYSFPEVVWGMGISSRGSVYAKVQLADFKGELGGSRHRLIRFSDDMAHQTIVDSAVINDNIYITEPMYTNVPVPFADMFLWELSTEGNVVVATTSDCTIKARSHDSESIYEVRHEIERQRVTKNDRERHFAGMSTIRDGVQEMGAPKHVRDNTQFPEHKPAFRQMLIDHEGYVLLQTWEGDQNSQVWLVFEPDGSFLGRVDIPGLIGAAVSDGYVYRLKIDDEYNSVQRSRLVIPGQADGGS